MAENKTKPTGQSIDEFIDAQPDKTTRDDCRTLVRLMKKVTGEEPKMWGSSIIGFGSYHYRYDSGREGDSCVVGFAPRKAQMSIYLTSGFAEREELLARLGKHKTSKGCLYVKRLSDIDTSVLEELVERTVATVRERNP